ncbi:hypothetical protein D3C75_901040 [compost metagenome]
MQEHRQFAVLGIELTLAGDQCLQGGVTVTATLGTDLLPDAVLCQQAHGALRLGEHEEEVALPQLFGKAVVGRHQIRTYRAQAQTKLTAVVMQPLQQRLRHRRGDPRSAGGLRRHHQTPAIQALPVMSLEAGAGVVVQLIRAADGSAPGHQAEAAVLRRQQQLQFAALARMVSQQAAQRIQGQGGGLAALGDKAQAAQPVLFRSQALAQAYPLGAEHGDETIRRQM